MTRIGRLAGDAVFVLQVMITFVLIFEDRLVLPAVLQAVGRMHPMLLHLPIGILIVTVILLLAEKHFTDDSYHRLVSLLIILTALTASLTTLMGLLLSLEGSFSGDALSIHKWTGVALSFTCWLLLGLRRYNKAVKSVGVAALVMIVVTGHYGAGLTHGDNFVLAPFDQSTPRPERTITDSSTVFEATVQLIFDAKCVGCHNPGKAKGQLVLTSADGLTKGGKGGAAIVPTEASNSLLMQRLLLPLDHDDHMPPKDKAQLLDDEIALIRLWIEAGADMRMRLSELPEADTLSELAALVTPRYLNASPRQRYSFKFASTEQVQRLNKPNRAVFQIARTEPALQADFYLRNHFDGKDIEELLAVRTQLVALNLGNMPVNDEALKIIAQFENLEELNLNKTDITGEGLRHLTALRHLKSLSMTGTGVDAADVQVLGAMTGLAQVFLWNTEVDDEEANGLTRAYPHITWDTGFVPDREERLQLNAPLARNKGQVLAPDEKIVLHHSLPGTTVRYTVDGTDPDSSASPVFSQAFAVGPYTLVKAKAYREGWISSDVAEFVFFRKGLRPDSAFLQTTPDEKYPGEGATTLVDELKGIPNFYRHPSWMAFREEDLVFDFSFTGEAPEVNSVTLSFANSPRSLCFPPAEIALWGGRNPDDLRLLTSMLPERTRDRGAARIEGVQMKISPARYPYYRLVARPVRDLPNGNPNNYDLWLMIDEVFIN